MFYTAATRIQIIELDASSTFVSVQGLLLDEAAKQYSYAY